STSENHPTFLVRHITYMNVAEADQRRETLLQRLGSVLETRHEDVEHRVVAAIEQILSVPEFCLPHSTGDDEALHSRGDSTAKVLRAAITIVDQQIHISLDI